MSFEQVASAVKDLGVAGVLLVVLWGLIAGKICTRGEVEQVEKRATRAEAGEDRALAIVAASTTAINTLADRIDHLESRR